jgi:hypothetical protein
MNSGFSLLFATDAGLLAVILGVLMILAMYCGFRVVLLRKGRTSSVESDSSSAIFGALLALLGLLLAFTFGMAGTRFDDRRKVITQEANDIGTAILRCDLYPEDVRKELRTAFKSYVEARITYLEAGTDLEKVQSSLVEKDKHAATIWMLATKFAHDNPSVFIPSNQMIPALNDMIDITTTRLALDTARVPDLIIILLFTLAVISSFFGGYMFGNKGRIDWFISVGFCIIIPIVVYTTLDLERTRRGITNLNANNRYIIQLRDMVKEP